MTIKFLAASLITVSVAHGQLSPKASAKEQYIGEWKEIAIQQMELYKIPASITMAQAILESGSGQSELAKNANNHFGIKCHSWKGSSYTMDDDAKDECFRKYKNASKSFEDHSLFLTTRSRYDFLFDLNISDYKGWAKGLKKAGYATNPKYAGLLIQIIEEHQLYKLDEQSSLPENIETIAATAVPVEESDFSNIHNIQVHSNRVAYVVAKKGDTFYQIAKEFELSLWQLYKYNDYGKKDNVIPGDIIYLQPKRNKSKKKEKTLVVESKKSLADISQEQCLKLKKLMEYNDIDHPNSLLAEGTVVNLRRP